MQRVVVVVCLAFVFTQACGAPSSPPASADDAGVTPQEDAGVTVEVDAGRPAVDFCRELAQLKAQLDRRCGAMTDAGVDDHLTLELAACEGFPGEARRFDAMATAPCLAAWRDAACETVVDAAVCDDAAPGVVAAGSGCHADVDCEGDLFCDRSSTCPGVCAARVALDAAVKEGQQCVREGYARDGTCQARVAVGASCAAPTPDAQPRACALGAFCNGESLCQAEVRGAVGDDCREGLPPCARGLACGLECLPARGLGAACDRWDSPCQEDLSCVEGTCVAPGLTGAKCDPFDAKCADTHFCKQEPGSFDGACQPRAALGGACSWRDFFGCRDGLYCEDPDDGGVCVPKKVEGASCVNESECPQFTTCTNSVCTRLGAGGAACESGHQCLSGNCLGDRCTVTDACPAW